MAPRNARLHDQIPDIQSYTVAARIQEKLPRREGRQEAPHFAASHSLARVSAAKEQPVRYGNAAHPDCSDPTRESDKSQS